MSKVHSDRFRSMQHLIAGAVLALKGFDKLEHSELYVGSTLLVLGSFVLAYFALDRLARDRSATWLTIMVHMSEGFAFLCLSYLYFRDGKTYLPSAAVIAAAGYCVAALIHGLRAKVPPHQLRVRDREATARFFVAALGFTRREAEGDEIVLRRPGIEVRVLEVEPADQPPVA